MNIQDVSVGYVYNLDRYLITRCYNGGVKDVCKVIVIAKSPSSGTVTVEDIHGNTNIEYARDIYPLSRWQILIISIKIWFYEHIRFKI